MEITEEGELLISIHPYPPAEAEMEPTEVEYAIVEVNKEPRSRVAMLGMPIEVEGPCEIRFRFIQDGVQGDWTDKGIAHKHP